MLPVRCTRRFNKQTISRNLAHGDKYKIARREVNRIGCLPHWAGFFNQITIFLP